VAKDTDTSLGERPSGREVRILQRRVHLYPGRHYAVRFVLATEGVRARRRMRVRICWFCDLGFGDLFSEEI